MQAFGKVIQWTVSMRIVILEKKTTQIYKQHPLGRVEGGGKGGEKNNIIQGRPKNTSLLANIVNFTPTHRTKNPKEVDRGLVPLAAAIDN